MNVNTHTSQVSQESSHLTEQFWWKEKKKSATRQSLLCPALMKCTHYTFTLVFVGNFHFFIHTCWTPHSSCVENYSTTRLLCWERVSNLNFLLYSIRWQSHLILSPQQQPVVVVWNWIIVHFHLLIISSETGEEKTSLGCLSLTFSCVTSSHRCEHSPLSDLPIKWDSLTHKKGAFSYLFSTP